MAKLTKAQQKALERLAEKPQDLTRQPASYIKSGRSARPDILKRLIAMGLAEYAGNEFWAQITPAGLAAIGRAQPPAEPEAERLTIADALVNQPGWKGTTGSGLNVSEPDPKDAEIAALKAELAATRADLPGHIENAKNTPNETKNRSKIVETWESLDYWIQDYQRGRCERSDVQTAYDAYVAACKEANEGYFYWGDILNDDLESIPHGYPDSGAADFPLLNGVYDTPRYQRQRGIKPTPGSE